MTNRAMQQTAQKQAEKWHKTTADIAVTPMSHTDAWPIARVVLGMAELVIFSQSAEAGAERCQ